jgi:peptidoglycan/xylan/chitin deacetylase (PgdA/CDA1 family)
VGRINVEPKRLVRLAAGGAAITVLVAVAAVLLWWRAPGPGVAVVAAAAPAVSDRAEPEPASGPGPGPTPEPVSEPGADLPPRRRATIPVPVLMYHEIRQGPNNLYLPADQLADQLDALQQDGFKAITLEQLFNAYVLGAKLPLHPVVLTFDDGYTSFYTNALPLLKKHGYSGTLFVITGSVGKPGFVTWDQVKESAKAGMEIGAHTVNHPDLSKSDVSRQSFELKESRRLLEEQIRRPVRVFAYPAGQYSDRTLVLTREAGYLAAVTTEPGLAAPSQDVYRWHRIRINPGMTGKWLVSRIRSMEAETPSGK